jgi:tryptophanyl-tRNA synthetase
MINKKKKRILTGDTPTGKLHVGHYVGTLENRVKLQDEYETFIILADTHALTTLHQSPSVIRQHTFDVLLDNLSAGLNPEKVTFFVESEIPEIYELAALFSMFISHNRALRNPTIKDEITMKKLGDQFSLGFINYPVYQAADILCVKGDLVPVGQDQEAHLEQSREIARVFNKIAGKDIFPEPKALIGRVGKLVGTDGNPKMSKTLGNTIYLSDSEEEVESKVMKMYTDPTRLKVTDKGHVEGNPVFIYLDTFSKDEDKEKVEEYKRAYRNGGVGDVEVKKYLIKILTNFMKPIRENRKKYQNDSILLEILNKGNKRVREEAQKTLSEVKKTLGLFYELL